MNYAKVYLRLNELQQAKQQLILAIRAEPENSEAHYLLGKLYLDGGDYDKMNEHYALSLKFSDEKKSAIEVDRFTTFSRIYSIGVEHFLKGDEETDEAKKKEAYEKAIVEMGNAYKVDKDIRALEGMALSHYGLSNDEEAERLFKLVLEEDPQNKNSLLSQDCTP